MKTNTKKYILGIVLVLTALILFNVLTIPLDVLGSIYAVFPGREGISISGAGEYVANQNGDRLFTEGDSIKFISGEYRYAYVVYVNDEIYNPTLYIKDNPPWCDYGGDYIQYLIPDVSGSESLSMFLAGKDPYGNPNFNLNDFTNMNIRENKLVPGTHFVEVTLAPFVAMGDYCGWATNQFSNNANSEYIKYFNGKIVVEALPCVLDDNQFLVVESYAQSQTYSSSTLRWTPVKYCGVHPVVITDTITKTTWTDASIYSQLENGLSITVPEGRTHSVFYVMDNDGTLPILCPADQAYHTDEGKCVDTIGFITVCETGTFDPSTGVCITQAPSSIVCPEGGRYDTALQKCIINPDVQAECPTGTTFDETANVCYYIPDLSGYCPQGSYHAESDTCRVQTDISYLCLTGELKEIDGIMKCVITPEESIYCGSGLVFNPDTNKCEGTASGTGNNPYVRSYDPTDSSTAPNLDDTADISKEPLGKERIMGITTLIILGALTLWIVFDRQRRNKMRLLLKKHYFGVILGACIGTIVTHLAIPYLSDPAIAASNIIYNSKYLAIAFGIVIYGLIGGLLEWAILKLMR